MLVLEGEKFSRVKIIGWANSASIVDFKALVSRLRQRGCGYFVLDLSECRLMDSAFLGVLAGFGLEMRRAQKDSCDLGIELFNPNPRIVESLETLGILHLFKLNQGPLPAAQGTEARAVEPLNPSKEEVKRACLEAHQTLMQINPDNVSRFQEVAQFLAETSKKTQE
jgi:anti-anti-sigma regulatory factor